MIQMFMSFQPIDIKSTQSVHPSLFHDTCRQDGVISIQRTISPVFRQNTVYVIIIIIFINCRIHDFFYVQLLNMQSSGKNN